MKSLSSLFLMADKENQLRHFFYKNVIFSVVVLYFLQSDGA